MKKLRGEFQAGAATCDRLRQFSLMFVQMSFQAVVMFELHEDTRCRSSACNKEHLLRRLPAFGKFFDVVVPDAQVKASSPREKCLTLIAVGRCVLLPRMSPMA